jgi:hypothetical protein
MRPVAWIVHTPLIALILLAASSVAAEAHRCDAFLPDGRIVRAESAFDRFGRTCDEFFSGRRGRAHEFFRFQRTGGGDFFASRRGRVNDFFVTRPFPFRDGFARREFEFRNAAREFELRQVPQRQPRMGFTTGSIGPFTTFSNSPPLGARHR